MADWKVDTSKPVMVTGATGYIAGVLVKELLSRGVTVHAAVRNPSNKEALQYLTNVADTLPGTIKFFGGDLTTEGSYEEGMKGCGVVFHTASPFHLHPKDPENEVVKPAVEGTRNVLRTATKVGTVRRVVVTSSVVTVYMDACDTYKAPNNALTEDVWNFNASREYLPYAFSKVMAELAAWQEAASQRRWTLATIHPSMVLGPGLKYHESCETVKIMKQFGDGTLAFGTPNFNMGVVDVRDVAVAHVVAGYNESSVGRYIISGHNTDFVHMAETILQKFPNLPLAARAVPKLLVLLLAPYLPAGTKREYVAKNIGFPINFDNSKSKRELGMEYRPLETTMGDMFRQLIDEGVVKQRK